MKPEIILSQNPCPNCGKIAQVQQVVVCHGFHKSARAIRIVCSCGLGTPNFFPYQYCDNPKRALVMALRFWGYHRCGEDFERKYALFLSSENFEI